MVRDQDHRAKIEHERGQNMNGVRPSILRFSNICKYNERSSFYPYDQSGVPDQIIPSVAGVTRPDKK